MMGLFSEWQPRYADHGVATFPVRADKTPAVKGYLKIGSRTSDQLALKFPEVEAIGLACKRNRITVLDVDTTDERVLEDGLISFGATPFIVRSGSGHFQAWYRNSGERRRVRPDAKVPIDILGDGFVVAPPSRSAKGRYEIISGSLDDLDRLPTMQRHEVAALAANDVGTFEPELAGMTTTPQERRSAILEGRGRNEDLFRQCMKMARSSRSLEELMERAVEHNRSYPEPMSADEVLKVVASSWGYEVEGKNWFGYGPRVTFEHGLVDDLAADEPMAWSLLTILHRHHWGRDFVLSKAFADHLGWTLRSFKTARNVLIERGLIVCIHPGGRGPGDPPQYRFPDKGYENAPQ
jgi:hypothetical protein